MSLLRYTGEEQLPTLVPVTPLKSFVVCSATQVEVLEEHFATLYHNGLAQEGGGTTSTVTFVKHDTGAIPIVPASSGKGLKENVFMCKHLVLKPMKLQNAGQTKLKSRDLFVVNVISPSQRELSCAHRILTGLSHLLHS